MTPNRKYKDSMFVSLFSDEERLLELYNAVERKTYPPDTKIEINTLDNALYLDRINDVSFIIGDRLVVLVENQSTINNNMPLRFLLYLSRIYEKIVDNKTIYKKKLVKIPKPEFIVLYNGTDYCTDYSELRLSDAFLEADIKTELELIVKIYNVNPGYNNEILQRSKTLNDYIFFIGRVRDNVRKGNMELTEAIKESIMYCIEHEIMRQYLENYGAEVINMLFAEFKLEDAIQVSKAEGIEEGIEKGIEKGIVKGAFEKAVQVAQKALKLNLSTDEIMELTGLAGNDIEKLRIQI